MRWTERITRFARRHDRMVWTCTVASMTVMTATGSVHAQGVMIPAQINDLVSAVERLIPIFGSLAVFIVLVLAIVYRILALRQPVTNNDLELLKEQNRTKELELEEKNIAAREIRDAKRDERDTKRDEQMDRMLGQLEKDHNRMHENQSAMMQSVQDEVAAKREYAAAERAQTAELARHHNSVETRLVAIERDIGTINTSIGSISSDIAAVKKSTGADTAVHLSTLMTKLGEVANGFASLLPEFRSLVTDIESERNSHETPTDPIHPAGLSTGDGTAVAAVTGADAGTDSGGNTGADSQ